MAIVDAYSTGRYLVPEFAKHGYGAVHIKSSRELPSFLTDSFPTLSRETLAEYPFDGNFDALADRLREHEVSVVLPGTESGVALAARLSETLGTPRLAIGSDDAVQFRDKGRMAGAAENHGIQVPKWAVVTSASQLRSWMTRTEVNRVVVKPTASAGTDGVQVCNTVDEAVAAFSRIYGLRNLLGILNDQVVIQEYVDGTEFFVNSVSHRGRHKALEVWRYSKTFSGEGAKVYDFEEPLRRSDPLSRELGQFTARVLDALGMENGPAHTEIMMRDGVFYLIESAARLGGSVLPSVVEGSMGASQVSTTVELVVGAKQIDEVSQSEPSGALRYVSLICHDEGEVDPRHVLSRLHQLPSARSINLGFSERTHLRRTRDSATSPGVVYLAADDPHIVERDYARLREMEREGLYNTFE
ncbi:ATP-grasp domain-containing protein [Sphaerimonospora thailandensis]|uniref:ATP-grasp domain-containing protein n=1 Tax=Sphaerimonospora thailandensis TaxID=795644 RepID=UPI0019516CB0|nr:ATP-grasp domain-containing protein [Sphaerimonospora thailandensis]